MTDRLNVVLSVKLPQWARRGIKELAHENDTSMSEIAREYILDGHEADGFTEEAEHGRE